MRKSVLKIISCVLPGVLILSGCAVEKVNPNLEEAVEVASQEWSIPFDFHVNAETFELSFEVNGQTVPISGGSDNRITENYAEKDGAVSWNYPDEQVQVQLTPQKNYLEVQITSTGSDDISFVWPSVTAEQYYLPLGEGKRVPADDSAWINYLNQQQVSVTEQLSMPFWISESDEYCVLFIMENPYRTHMEFSAQPELSFSVSHEYPEIDTEKTNSYRIYVTENNPVNCAKIYRRYIKEKGQFVTLEQKAEQNPNIEKLYGAPFVYLWGDNIISSDDINWGPFRQSIDTAIMDYLSSFSSEIENGSEFENTLSELRNQDYVAVYQKNVICNYISYVLRRDDFWNGNIFSKSNYLMDTLLQEGYENLTDTKKLQLHKEALATNMPDVFHAASDWMNASTLDLLSDMKKSGIDHAWIGLNSWEQAYAKPNLTQQAADMDYLIASYDSYHSIHAPGKEQWITARFEDDTLYETATVTDKNGNKESGFQNVGRKLNPTLSMPAVKSRMESIMSNHLSFNSWFIDCDATGEIYDDYTPEHITTQQQDLEARLKRIAYIRDQYDFVIGSEGGNDFAASTIAFAHGIELPSFSWRDADMKSNKESEYYIGRYYNPTGGVAEHFSKRIPVKEQYFLVFVDPQYDIPLFKLVYNDSVVSAAHWDWSTFKIKGATQDRMLREVLYNVPPIYHLDSEQWEEYKNDIVSHHKVWSDFSSKAIQREMTDFTYLQEDGSVQKTVYGDNLLAIANFSDVPYSYDENEIPAHSVLIEESGQIMIYTPSLADTHK
ncbi:MAG: molecular chaperone GroEL [Clostridiales bacterium]|nr:molecular chaperone GroEL [Clostridiales bacterium]